MYLHRYVRTTQLPVIHVYCIVPHNCLTASLHCITHVQHSTVHCVCHFTLRAYVPTTVSKHTCSTRFARVMSCLPAAIQDDLQYCIAYKPCPQALPQSPGHVSPFPFPLNCCCHCIAHPLTKSGVQLILHANPLLSRPTFCFIPPLVSLCILWGVPRQVPSWPVLKTAYIGCRLHCRELLHRLLLQQARCITPSGLVGVGCNLQVVRW